MKKVSVIVPIYNMEKSIERCLSSLQNQDYPNLEIILIDDGSTDNTLYICNNIAKKDSRMVVVHTNNRGSGPARNTGIENATGEYAYFPDADDYLEPNAISIMVNAMNDSGADLVVFGFRNVNQDGKVLLEKKYESSIQNSSEIRNAYKDYIGYTAKWGIQGAPWNKFFDLNIIKKAKIEYPSLRRHQDEGFIGRYMCVSKKVCFIGNILYTYYINDLKKEWQKYPIDYIDSVIGLYDVRKSTILSWNVEDYETKSMINHEYICNTIKALELTFSPKMTLGKDGKREWILQLIEKSGLQNIDELPTSLGKYQKYIMTLIRINNHRVLYYSLMAKVWIENSKIYHFIRTKRE